MSELSRADRSDMLPLHILPPEMLQLLIRYGSRRYDARLVDTLIP